MRVTPTRALYIFCLVMVLLLMVTLLRQNHNKNFTETCNMSKEYQQSLHQLAADIHHVLYTLSLTHFLCFGSLWGLIRHGKTLPWEKDIEFCVINTELSSFDEVYLIRVFKKHGLNLEYDSSEGMYILTRIEEPHLGHAQLIVFEKDSELNMMRRVGWKRRMLPPNCDTSPTLQCFPSRLIEKPLPMKEFAGKFVPVPKEDFEIQKYLFPNDWWQEVKPKNC